MNELPLFYEPAAFAEGRPLTLSEETARHAVQVLRLKTGDQLRLTDGRGTSALATLTEVQKKQAAVLLTGVRHHTQATPRLHLGVAFTKNAGRNEWLLEKAVELGAQAIIPLSTTRSVPYYPKEDRWNGILISAMLQSQQYYLPGLEPAHALPEVLATHKDFVCLLPHCGNGARQALQQALPAEKNALILIGPEGDFTGEEVTLATSLGALPVSLGATRLRTETAAMAACAYFHLINDPATQ